MKEVNAIGAATKARVIPPLMVLHSADYDFQPTAILTFDVESDYVRSWTDYIRSEITVTMAQYSLIISSASKSILEATIMNGPFGDVRYRAIVEPTKDLPNDDALKNIGESDMNQSLSTITLQLVNIAGEFISTATTSGVYGNLTVTDMIRSTLNEVINENDMAYPIEAIEVCEADNKEQIKNIVIPTDTPLLKIPMILQKDEVGVYSGGINLYIYHYQGKSRLRVYAPTTCKWSTTDPENRLILWDLYDNTMNYRERTYDIYPPDSKQVQCIVSKQIRAPEASEAREVVRSSGFHVVSADQMMDGYHTISPKQVTTNTNRVNSRVSVGDRSDDLHKFNTAGKVITNNRYDVMSGIRLNRGLTYRFVWNNSNPELLYPGMPIKVNSQVKAGFVERYGTLAYAYTSYTRVNGLRSDDYKVVTYLVVMVDNEEV